MDTVAAVFEDCFNMEASPLFFPVRHHSPACTFHLQKVLEEYEPDLVLIEGPADTNHLIKHIGHPGNTAPLCIYYSYTHKKTSDKESFRSSCYYPLLDFSPELFAIRWSTEKAIPCRFIDLPYSQLSMLERQREQKREHRPEQGHKTEQEREAAVGPSAGSAGDEKKPSYYDDYHMARSRYIARLCEKEGLRDYSELWEKLFEIQGLSMDSDQFVKAMLALCHFSRVEYPKAMLEEEGCLEREGFMAWEIKEAMKDHQRILVVTGGFHTHALSRLIKGTLQPKKAVKGAESYLIPYSFSESDQLSGYASGMPYPAFYQKVHEHVQAGEGEPYNKAVLTMLAQIGGKLRRKKESVSIADEGAAYAQSKGLAALRGKRQQGVYELLDGVLSAYIKGPLDTSASLTLAAAEEHLRGDRMGEVASGAEQVPLLLDFQTQAKKHRLKIDRVVRNDAVLDILAKPSHRQLSVFFHRLDYLDSGFCRLQAGPDYRQRDAQRVRERWSYLYNTRVESALIDVSYLGGTVREASSSRLMRQKQDGLGCGEYTKMLIDAAVMDLNEHTGSLLAAVSVAVSEDGSFFSLVQAGENLAFLETARWLLQTGEMSYIPSLIQQIYVKSAALLPSLSTSRESQDGEIAESLKELYHISLRKDVDETLLAEGLKELCGQKSPPPCTHGSAAGLLYGSGEWSGKDVLAQAESYLYGTEERMKQSGLFLRGLFLSAWDLLFEEDGLLEGLGNVLKKVEQDDFLKLLPDLRLAFSSFTPGQTDRIAQAAAAQMGIKPEEIHRRPVDEKILRLGQKLDLYARTRMEGGGEDGAAEESQADG